MSIVKKLKDNFVAGTFLIAPLAVTLIIISFLADWASIIINPVVKEAGLVEFTSNNALLAQAIATVLVVSFITVLGIISNYRFGRGIKSFFGRFVNLIPLFGSIYLSVHQVASSLSNDKSKFRKVVLMEYPREGVRSIGMVTSESPKAVQKVSDDKMFSVFFPNSPNPTGGRTVMVPESEFTEIDMTVQEGIKLMLTTGMAFEDHELPESLKDN